MPRAWWTDPDGFPVEAALEAMFQDALRRGDRPFRDRDFCNAFGVDNGTGRQVEFIRRGRGGQGWRGPLLEVLLTDGGEPIRLGPCFGIEEHACVVVNGYDGARNVCNAWLGGGDIASVVASAEFYSRRGLSLLLPTAE